MRFLPIGTRWWVDRKWETIQLWVVWHLPSWVIRWSVIRATAYATTGQYGSTILPEIPAVDVLQRWDKR